MVNYYLLSLYVTFEQEEAIRELFIDKGWDLAKCEAADQNGDYSSWKRIIPANKETDPENKSPKSDLSKTASLTDDMSLPSENHDSSVENQDNNEMSLNKRNTTCKKTKLYAQSSTSKPLIRKTKVQASCNVEYVLASSSEKDPENYALALNLKGGSDDVGSLELDDDETVESDDTISDYADFESVLQLQSQDNDKLEVCARDDGNRFVTSADIKKFSDVSVKKMTSEGTACDRLVNKFTTVKGKSSAKQTIYKVSGDSSSGHFKNLYCKDCKCTYKLLGQFKRHKRFGKCVFECQLCGKVYTSRYYASYLCHLKRHQNERSYTCKICEKAFNFARGLEQHMKTHTDPREFICQHCGKEFLTARNLFVHCKTMHDKDRQFFRCDICNSSLSSLGSLKVHKRDFHSSEKQYVCEICGKSFKALRTLQKSHALVHMEDLPYACTFAGCHKKFKRSGGLAKHMQRHNNDRRFPCDSCEMRFYSNADLVKHYRTHTGEKPFQCAVCSYCCALPGNLRKHMKVHRS